MTSSSYFSMENAIKKGYKTENHLARIEGNIIAMFNKAPETASVNWLSSSGTPDRSPSQKPSKLPRTRD